MQLKIYQEEAIDDLLNKAKKLLNMEDGKKLVFKAPTGSGKTIMMAEFLKQLVDDKDVKQPLSFIWTAPKKLHIQSKEKLENYYEKSRTLECSYFEDLSDRKIDENEILFFNWSSVNKKGTNTIVKENEQEFYLSKVLERTREEGRKIILIIDEVHYSAGQMDKKEKSAALQLRKDIEPALTIEVSATPILAGDYDVTVQVEEVKKEAMIKKSLILNENFVNVFKDGKIKTELGESTGKDSEEAVIKEALEKRDELIKSYRKEGSEINPLVLIQLPDRKGQREDELKEKIIKILKDKFHISTEKGNNKLAIWLSGEHVNKEDVERNDSEVEVLLFKQAIALGWDCPRAQVMALFREWHSPIFSIQTVGRIMRMPEPDRGKYYKEDILNYAYIYTNINDIVIDKDVAPGYVSFLTSKRITDYKDINLLSCYSKRHREKTRLSPLFIEMFLAQVKKYGLKDKIDNKARKISLKIVSDFKAKDVDALAGSKIIGDKAIAISGDDLQRLFDYFVRNNLRPQFYPEDRSVNRAKEAMYRFFEKELKMKFSEKWDEIVRIILDEKNSQEFINVLDKTKNEYQDEVVKIEGELALSENWNVPEVLPFGDDYVEENKNKAAMKPFYVKYLSGMEKSFTGFLDKSDKIEWWFKNGDRDATFFAVPYDDNKTPFYVDFVVKMKDGRIGLFDPHGTYLADSASKSDGLQEYIKKENKKEKNLFGGIVANTQRDCHGRWVIFKGNGENLKDGYFKNWEDLIW